MWIALAVTLAAFGQKPDFAVVEKVAGAVGFYTAGGKRVGGAKVGTHPHEIVLSPDRKLAYVSDNGILWMQYAGEGGNTISILAVASRKKTGEIDLGNYRRPHGLDIHPKTGRMVSTIENPPGLLLIDPVARKVLRKYDTQGKAPHMALFDPDGETVYVSNTGTNTVAVLNLESGGVKLIDVEKNPQGGTFSRDGKLLFLTSSDGDAINIIDRARKERIGTIRTGRGPARVHVAPDNKTLIYNLQPGEAMAFADIASRKETTVIKLAGKPLSLTMAKDASRVYLGLQEVDKIVTVSVKDRKLIDSFETPKGAGPDVVLPLP
ncbi:beta-propeller fold lactonase family protein [uncultured Phenylobacterium sp.]|uniref:YncE family protein n=1 Tax=uncultured Phenylobacterium sp. TaxID=349273 RepID=UPI0025E6B73F|nr:beta-propeller fold lactonase family protein [uncultured Phenylobacterium sp.]